MPEHPAESHSAQGVAGGKHFRVTIVTPAGVREEYSVVHLRAPGTEGQFGVLVGHIPFMTGLKVGALYLDTAQGRRVWATSGGYAEVLGDQVIILAETAEPAEKIDTERAEAARKRALDRLDQPGENLDVKRARAALSRALNRLSIARSQGGG